MVLHSQRCEKPVEPLEPLMALESRPGNKQVEAREHSRVLSQIIDDVLMNAPSRFPGRIRLIKYVRHLLSSGTLASQKTSRTRQSGFCERAGCKEEIVAWTKLTVGIGGLA